MIGWTVSSSKTESSPPAMIVSVPWAQSLGPPLTGRRGFQSDRRGRLGHVDNLLGGHGAYFDGDLVRDLALEDAVLAHVERTEDRWILQARD